MAIDDPLQAIIDGYTSNNPDVGFEAVIGKPPAAPSPDYFKLQTPPPGPQQAQPPQPMQEWQPVAPPPTPQDVLAEKRDEMEWLKKKIAASAVSTPRAGFERGLRTLKSFPAYAAAAGGQAIEGFAPETGKKIREWGIETAEGLEREADLYREGRTTKIEDIRSPGQALEFAIGGLGEVAPTVLESIGFAILGGAAGTALAGPAGTVGGTIGGALGRGALKGFLKNQLERETAKHMVASGVTRAAAEQAAKRTVGRNVGAAVGLFGSSYVQGVGDIYGETLDDEKKGNLLTSFALAMPYAVLDSVAEMYFAKNALTGVAGEVGFKDAFRRYGRAVLGGALREGTTEALQEVLALGAGMNEGKEYSIEQILSQLGNSFALGALAGGVMGAPGGRRQAAEPKTLGDVISESIPGGPDSPIGGIDRATVREALNTTNLSRKTRAEAMAAAERAFRDIDPAIGDAFHESFVDAIANNTPAVPTDELMRLLPPEDTGTTSRDADVTAPPAPPAAEPAVAAGRGTGAPPAGAPRPEDGTVDAVKMRQAENYRGWLSGERKVPKRIANNPEFKAMLAWKEAGGELATQPILEALTAIRRQAEQGLEQDGIQASAGPTVAPAISTEGGVTGTGTGAGTEREHERAGAEGRGLGEALSVSGADDARVGGVDAQGRPETAPTAPPPPPQPADETIAGEVPPGSRRAAPAAPPTAPSAGQDNTIELQTGEPVTLRRPGAASASQATETPPAAAPQEGRGASGLTPEADDLLRTVDAGGVPLARTRNLERIATENGVTLDEGMSARDVIEAIRARRDAGEGPGAARAPAVAAADAGQAAGELEPTGFRPTHRIEGTLVERGPDGVFRDEQGVSYEGAEDLAEPVGEAGVAAGVAPEGAPTVGGARAPAVVPEALPGAAVKSAMPWAGHGTEDETRWYGTRVRLTALGENKRGLLREGEATLSRVLNKGNVLEVRWPGQDFDTRVSVRGQYLVEVLELKDGKRGPSVAQPGEKAPADEAAGARGTGVATDWASTERVQAEQARVAAHRAVVEAVLSTDAVRNAAASQSDNLVMEIKAQVPKVVGRLMSEAAEAGGPLARLELEALGDLVAGGGGQVNTEILTDEVLEAWAAEARKQARKAQRAEQKLRHERVLLQAVTDAWAGRADVADDVARAEFVRGFDHAIEGGTGSNLAPPAEGLVVGPQVARDGYDAGVAWLQTEDGQAFVGGKAPRKMTGVGEQLRRRQDALQRVREIDITKDEDAEEFISKILVETARGNVFELDEAFEQWSGTPGLWRYLVALRNQILPFKEWMAKNGYGSTKRATYYATPVEALKREAAKGVDERRRIQEFAAYYVEQVNGLKTVFDGAKTVKEAIAALEKWLDSEGPSVAVGELQRPARAFTVGHRMASGRFMSSLSRGKIALRFTGTWAEQSFMRDEHQPLDRARNKPLVRPRFDRVVRAGQDYRNGRDITAEELAQTFGLRGVTYGEGVTSKQRQDHTNYTFDAFMDLAAVLGIEPKAIGLGRRLAFAFGALGRGRAGAHYTPDNNGQGQAINLTNTRGDGAVAHEWFHALDYNLRTRPAEGGTDGQQGIVRDMVALLRYDIPGEDAIANGVRRFLSGESRWTNMGKRATPQDHARLYLERTIRDLRNVIERGQSGDKWTGATHTQYHKEALDLGKDYWANGTEEFARAGEAFVFDALEGENNYLVSDWVEELKAASPQYRGTPYPVGDERAFFNDAFRRMFDALEWGEDGPSVKVKQWDASPLRQKAIDAIAAAERMMDDLGALLKEEQAKQREAEAERAQSERERAAAEEKARAEQAAKLQSEWEELKATQAPKAPIGFGDLTGLSDEDLEALFDAAAAEQHEAAQEPERGPAVPVEGAEQSEMSPGFVDDPIAPIKALAQKLTERDWSTPLSWQELFENADLAFGGTRAAGAYSTKDAYDALEMALNQVLTQHQASRRMARYVTQEPLSNEMVVKSLEQIEALDNQAPTQTNRTAEQDEFQQFSTPHAHAALMARVANIDGQDVVLEPSAGSGNLATLALQAEPLAVVVNELAPRRAEILRALGFEQVFAENAEHLSAILGPKKLKPTVVLMNPPFSASAGRLAGKRDNRIGAKHVAEALKLLAPGGRLVALMGDGYTRGNARVAEHWKWILQNFNVRANLGLDGEAYRKFGTTFDNRLVVIDHTGPTVNPDAILSGQGLSVVEAMKMLEGIRNDRIHVGEHYGTQSEGRRVAEAGALPGAALGSAAVAIGEVGASEPGAGGAMGEGAGADGGAPGVAGATGKARSRRGGASSGKRPGRRRAAGTGADWGGPAAIGNGGAGSAVESGGKPAHIEQPEGLKEIIAAAARHGVRGIDETMTGLYELFGGRNLKSFPGGFDAQTYAKARPHFERAAQEFIAAGRSIQEFFAFLIQHFGVGIKPYAMQFVRELRERPGATAGARPPVTEDAPPNEPAEAPAERADQPRELTDSIYDGYQADAYWATQGAKPHPSDLVESAAMSAVKAPPLTARPALPKAVIAEGRLSDAQLDVVAYAQQAHEQMLPDGKTRRGFLIGDGTGLGKGREISGIIYNNWLQGRKKAVWFSVNSQLAKDSREYLTAVAGSELGLFELAGIDANSPIESKEGVLFATYGTLISHGRGVKDATGKVVSEGQKRIDQIVAWLGKDFDGVIAFDEAHKMGNALSIKGQRGKKDPSKTAVTGVELQRRLPMARIVYASATAATEVNNLGYAERLGLWGEGTPFANKQSFISNIMSGGVAAMEVVAKDMKALGVYQARSLSYHGVTTDQLEHALTPAQREMYDVIAAAWQSVLRNVWQALDDTNSGRDGQAKGAAMSAFWGAQQRFFNQLLTALQMPSVLEAMQQDLSAGRSVVLQVVNTNEAATERSAAKIAAEDGNLEDLDITPRQTLMQYLTNAFPVNQYEEYSDEDGNVRVRPVVDSAGQPVQNPEAVAARDRLLDQVAAIRFPDGPLEILLNHFGADQVAEITGRRRRFVRVKHEQGERMEEQKRSEQVLAKETEEFQAGKRRILIFSDAGGTGLSYHADRTKQNQQKRVHYLLQPGWRADKAIQGLGRTHRTNQAQPPHVVLVTTDLRGHRRFVASIARRMDQLGALTKGQRQTGGQGIFTPEMNLESQWSGRAIEVLIADVMRGQVEGVTRDDFEVKMGFDLSTKENNRKVSSTPSIQQFLNRILALEVDLQARVFDAFFARLQQQIESARAAGTLDVGMETIKALRIRKLSDEVVYTHEATGSQTRLVDLELIEPVERWSFEQVMERGKRREPILFFKRNRKSGRVYAWEPARSETLDDGRVQERYRRLGVRGALGLDNPTEIGYPDGSKDSKAAYWNREANKKWETLNLADAASAWAAEYAATPSEEPRVEHMLTGVLLPIWDRLGDFPVTVKRALTDDGEIVLGRSVPDRLLDRIQTNLTGSSRAARLAPAELLRMVLEQGAVVRLANNWRIERRRVGNEWRVELRGNIDLAEGRLLQEQGAIYERINWEGRYFIPTSDVGAEVLGRVMRNRPAAEVIGDAAGDEVRFSLATGPARTEPLSARFLQARLNAITRGWKGLQQMPVKVVQREAQLPQSVRERLAEVRKNNPRARAKAVYVPGDGLYFIADNIAHVRDAMTRLAHEATGHHGVRSVFGPALDPFLDRLVAERNADVGLYARQYGLDMTDVAQRREAAEELLAHMAERQDPADLPFLRKVYQAIRAALRKMGVTLRITDGDLREILAASWRYVERGDVRGALKARERFAGAKDRQAGGRGADARFVFAGRQAQTADRMALETAQARLAAGEDAEAVRRETGWHRGVDKKWRFEINDEQAAFIALQPGEDGRRWAVGPLGSVLRHEALAAAYPQMMSAVGVDVEIGTGLRDEGVYRPSSNVIEVRAETEERALSVLLHEVQHGIQTIEGFASGTNLDTVANLPAFEFVKTRAGKILARRVQELGLSPDEARAYIDRQSRLLLYKRNAGETEARNVQARQRMTDVERALVGPEETADVKAGDVIVSFNGMDAANAPVPENVAGARFAEGDAASLPATIVVDGVQRPTTNSEGRPIHPTEEGVRNFWKWFADSKIIDDQGRPLLVYHGTSSDFSVFDPGKIGANFPSEDSYGFFFATDAITTRAYGNVTMPVYLKAGSKTTFDYDIDKDEWANIVKEESQYADNAVEITRDGKPHIYIVFDSVQIKSAIGNSGAFDPANPDIRFSLTDIGENIRARRELIVERARSAGGPENIAERISMKALGALTVRMLADVSSKVLPSGKRFVDAMQDFEHDARKMVDEAQKRVQVLLKQSPMEVRKLGDLENESTRLGIDASLDEAPQRHPDHAAARARIQQLRRQANRIARKGNNRTDDDRATQKALRAEATTIEREIAEDVKDRRNWSMLHRRFKAMPDWAQQAYQDHRDDYIAMSERMELAVARRAVKATLNAEREILKQIQHAGLSDSEKDALKDVLASGIYDITVEDGVIGVEVRQPAITAIMGASLPDAVKASIRAQIDAGLLAKRSMVHVVRAEFEAGRVQGIYFPLQRFGPYYGVLERPKRDEQTGQIVVDQHGEVVMEPGFVMHDSEVGLTVELKRLASEGWTIKERGYKIQEQSELLSGASDRFVTDVIEKLKAAGDESGADIVYQTFLDALPFLSARKHFIHRKGTFGFTNDLPRTYAHNMVHLAKQISRTENTPKFLAALEAMTVEAESHVDNTRASQFLGEFHKQYEAIMRPRTSPAAAWLTSFGFVFHLGLSPAAALVNLTQTAIMAYPQLASQYGWRQAGRILTDTMKTALKARFKKGHRLDYSQWGLSQDERDAMDYFHDVGAIDVTNVHSMLGLADSESLSYNPRIEQALQAIGWMFGEAEVVNRQATLLAGYRLARGAGKTHAEAMQAAIKDAYAAHGDYQSSNRARWLKGNTMRVIAQFRQYSQLVTFYLVRNAIEAMKGATAEERHAAQKRLFGTLGMAMLFAGSAGLPYLATAPLFLIANAALALFGDDDDERDAQMIWQDWLADMGLVGEIIHHGAINALPSAPDIAGRTSLNGLWLRPPNRDLSGKEHYHYLAENLLGPVIGGIGVNLFTAMGLMEEGHVQRGIEYALPKALRDISKTLRYAKEGATTLSGDPIVPEFTPLELIWQFNGFVPANLSAQYAANSAAKTLESRILRRRQALVTGYAMAAIADDADAKKRALQKIHAYNAGRPEMPIEMSTLRKSIKMRLRYREESSSGIHITPKLRKLTEGVDVPGAE